MKKKIFYLIVIAIMILSVNKVSALSNVYVNANNVEMEYELYERLCSLYSENYMEFVTQERYDELKETDFENVEVVQYEDRPLIQAYANLVETEYKIIKLVKSGKTITLHLIWKKIPATRSYDVMGIRFDGVKNSSLVIANQIYTLNGSSKRNSSSAIKTFDNGFGASFLLPSGSISALEEYVEFNFTGTGTVYGTYQHAQRVLSLADSKNYTISSTGLGGVLKFSTKTIEEKYDKMSGVSINV